MAEILEGKDEDDEEEDNIEDEDYLSPEKKKKRYFQKSGCYGGHEHCWGNGHLDEKNG